MLGICSEFERIAKAVIEKAERDHSSRRKRKNQGTTSKSSLDPTAGVNRSSATTPSTTTTQTPRRTSTAKSTATPTPSARSNYPTSPPLNGNRSPAFSVSTTMHNTPPPGPPSGWPQEFPVSQASQNRDYDSFDFSNGNMHSSPGSQGGMFQQPVLPVDLFSLPMTLDWNWAEMSGGAYPTVENGNFGHEQGQHHLPP